MESDPKKKYQFSKQEIDKLHMTLSAYRTELLSISEKRTKTIKLTRVSGTSWSKSKEGTPFNHWVVVVDGTNVGDLNMYYHLSFDMTNFGTLRYPHTVSFDGALTSRLESTFEQM